MADPFFRANVGDKTYELPRLTMGGANTLALRFGLTDMAEFNPANPLHLSGCLYLCLKAELPKASHEVLMAEIESIDIADFKAAPAPDPEPEPDPTPAVVDGGEESASSN
jgi:hypothetical protein